VTTHDAFVWNYPDHKKLTLDHGYVDDLHKTLRGKPGERFYVIAPVIAMAFAEDEVVRDSDDSNRNRAKCRDGLKHFETLNDRLVKDKEPWRYHFYFLSPEDYTSFFDKARDMNYAGWKSGLMQELTKG
jgi:hypothetical protein